LLGKIHIPLPRNRPRSENTFDVRFTYDVNGVLQVEAKLLSTGATHELIVEGNPGVLSKEEIRQRLTALEKIKIHPREEQANLAVIARIERMYEESLEQRAMLQDWLARFMGVLETQDRSVIDRHRTQLSQALDEVESVVSP
jgi:molecular chaperone HscC